MEFLDELIAHEDCTDFDYDIPERVGYSAYGESSLNKSKERELLGIQFKFTSNEIAETVYDIYTVKKSEGRVPKFLDKAIEIVIQDEK